MRPRTFSDQELLDVARELFLQTGPAVTTAQIAKKLGVSQAAVFKRFRTKEQLMVRALLPLEQPAWITRIEAGPTDQPVSEQLLTILHEVNEFFSKAMPAISVLRATAICQKTIFEAFPDGPPPVRAHRALMKFFQTLHDQGRIVAPEPRALASAFLGAVHGPHSLQHCLGDLAPDSGENYAEHMVQFFWTGICPSSKASV